MNKNYHMLVLLVTIISMVTLTSCKKDEMLKDYTGLTDKNHLYQVLDVTEVINKMEQKESFVLVMGFPECPWCQALIPVVNEVAKTKKANVIYYLNIKDIRDNENNSHHVDYLKLQNEYFKDALDEKNKRLNAPTIVKVENGQMTNFHLNTVDSHLKNENGVLPPLTSEQKEELISILNQFF